MAVVIPVMAYVYAKRQAGREGGAARVSARKLFPMFILAFVAMAAIRSIGDAGTRDGGLAFGAWSKAEWTATVAWIGNAAGYVLAMAMAGVGLGTRLKTLKGLGITPFYVGLFASAVVGVASAIAVFLLGGHDTALGSGLRAQGSARLKAQQAQGTIGFRYLLGGIGTGPVCPGIVG